jgi:hypothetical protein
VGLEPTGMRQLSLAHKIPDPHFLLTNLFYLPGIGKGLHKKIK